MINEILEYNENNEVLNDWEFLQKGLEEEEGYLIDAFTDIKICPTFLDDVRSNLVNLRKEYYEDGILL